MDLQVVVLGVMDWVHLAEDRDRWPSLVNAPSGRTMALGSTQLITEMSTRCISWGERRPVRKADNLTTILCRCHEIWEP